MDHLAVVSEYREYNCDTRSCHILTKAPEVTLLTVFQMCLIAGSVLPQIARLHHFSPFALPSSVAHIDFQARRSEWLTCSAAPCQPCW